MYNVICLYASKYVCIHSSKVLTLVDLNHNVKIYLQIVVLLSVKQCSLKMTPSFQRVCCLCPQGQSEWSEDVVGLYKQGARKVAFTPTGRKVCLGQYE
jgi:hypothetical protein